MRVFIVIALCLSALGGCASGPAVVGGPALQVTDQSALPPPPGIDPNVAERPYRIGAFDKLSVLVYGDQGLSAEVQADSNGRISLPLIGIIDAMGLTTQDLGQLVRQKLKQNYVRDPQVSVNLVETTSRVVTLDGAVREPGRYPVLGRLTLMEAIASAKGATEFAQLQSVVIFRNVGEQRYAALYSLKAIREGRYEDPEVFAGDLVFVGESRARRFFQDLLRTAPLLTSPLVALVR